MIRVLDELTINKIAAGEVVEGPFSVVKELVENSIDAKSDSIILEIKEGGKKYIRITDNGIGIPEDQVETAFLRHATSKITRLEDLESILSLGFRGEALASIASVAQVEIITKPQDQPYGISIEVAGGKIINKKQVGCPSGTTIIVKNMFFNTPARLKFMKSTGGETSKISEIITRLALSKPHVAFKYVNNNNIMFTTTGNGDLSQVILSVFDKNTYNSLIPLRGDMATIKIDGYISQPSYARGNRSFEIVFINGRYIKNKLIYQAIENAYRERLPINKYPVCMISISLDPRTIDVNVHPTKTEVKFHDEDEVYQSVFRLISEALTKKMLIPRLEISRPPVIKEIESKVETNMIPNGNESSKTSEAFQTPRKEIIEDRARPTTSSNLYNPPGENLNYQSSLLELIKEEEALLIPKEELIPQEVQESFIISLLSNQKVIGQLFNTYIILEKDSYMYLIDQHAAHERLIYNRIMKEFLEAKVVTQQLLQPHVLELSSEDFGVFSQYISNFTAIGFEIEEFGQNTVIIRGVPMVLGIPRKFDFLLDTIDDFKNSFDGRIPFHEKLIQKACKEAIKGKDQLNPLEIEQLLRDLRLLEPPLTCPHGRPIILSLTKHEIEKYFKRIQ